MKKNFLAVPFLVILFITISAHSTVSMDGDLFSDTGRSRGDTIKTISDSVSFAMDSLVIDSIAFEEHATIEPWREWKTVDNFAFGKNRGDLPMIADLQSLHPFFRDKISQLIINCKEKGIELAIVESYRTHAKQKEYYRMGRKYTRTTGGQSKHQYGLAVDVVPVKDSSFVWDDVNLWRKIGTEGEKLGLRWGGRWRSPYDPAHFEWSGGLTTLHLSQGVFPNVPVQAKESYPCIHEDIELLKKHWEMWETEQSVISRSGVKRGEMQKSLVTSH